MGSEWSAPRILVQCASRFELAFRSSNPGRIAHALRRVESGTAVAEVCRVLGVTETTFYRWKRKFHGVRTPELRELRQLCDENRKLKQVVADLTLDRTVLQEALRKEW